MTDTQSIGIPAVILSEDGTPIRTYEVSGEQPETVVVLNGYGMPFEFVEPTIRELARNYRVVTWDSRDVPLQSETFHEERSGLEGQIADVHTVMTHYRVSRAHLIGWCSGAQVALEFASQSPERVASVAMVNGSFGFPFAYRTDFETKLLGLMPKIAANRENASLYCRMLFGDETASGKPGLASLVNISDPTILAMTTRPFRTPETLFRYAHFVVRLYDRPDLRDWSALRVPMLLLANRGNDIASPDSSFEVARRLPVAAAEVIEDGGHFGVYTDPAPLSNRLRKFIASVHQEVASA